MTQSSTTHEHRRPLLDLDVLVYRCGFAADSQVKGQLEREGLEGDELVREMSEYDYEAYALGNVKQVIHEVRSKFRGEYRGFLTGDGNFREHRATILPYKGNRTGRKPKYYKEIKDYMLRHHEAELVHGREADDALASAQWAAKDKSTIICTIDKDLDMIPGWHYNWVKNEIYDISLRYANNRLFWQMLEGDRTDNIPGITGVGPKTIQRFFEQCDYDTDKIREIVQREYQREYEDRWKEAYEEVAALLWMERIEGKECPFLW